jgi:hypothetical protein
MGPLIRVLAVALLTVALGTAAIPARVAAFDGFGATAADATYGSEMVFRVQLDGSAPDRLELLLWIEGSQGTFVAPVQPSGGSAEYRWDAKKRYLTPNTRLDYRWRATDGGRVTLSPEGNLLYDDDRRGLDWRTARIGDATVHWYGGAEAQARHFGDLTAGAVERASALLRHQLDGPVDIFVYDSQSDFFGALGPGAREWTGAAAYPELRTVFMSLGGGPPDYLDTALVHEVTHVVFHDATVNPFHEPAKWINEGIAVWSERQSADAARSTVEYEATHGGLFSFDAISAQFPVGDRGARLSYAEGTTMIGMIIDRYGQEAIARLTAAFRDGASDEEALAAASGISADRLFADFYAAFGTEEPSPVRAAPIPASNVQLPGGAGGQAATEAAGSSIAASPVAVPDDRSRGGDGGPLVLVLLGALGLGAIGAVTIAWRRRPT